MAIRWYCDVCGKEIGKPDVKWTEKSNPTQLSVCTEGVNRDLEGYGEAEYPVKNVVGHSECIKSLTEEFVAIIKRRVTRNSEPY